jgi:hypothetical protein
MTIQLIKQTSKGVPAEFWKIKSCFYDSNVIEVEMNAYYDQTALESNQVLDTIKILSLDYIDNPLNKISARENFINYLQNNPEKSPYEAGVNLLEHFIIANIPEWLEGVQI